MRKGILFNSCFNMLLVPPFMSRVDRLGFSEGKNGKPWLCVGSNYHVWLGNLSDSPMNLEAQELFGFGLGSFEERAVSRLVF